MVSTLAPQSVKTSISTVWDWPRIKNNISEIRAVSFPRIWPNLQKCDHRNMSSLKKEHFYFSPSHMDNKEFIQNPESGLANRGLAHSDTVSDLRESWGLYLWLMRISVPLSYTQKGWWNEFTSAVSHSLSALVPQNLQTIPQKCVSQFNESNRQQKWYFKIHQVDNYRVHTLSQAKSSFASVFFPSFRRKPEAKTQFCSRSTNTLCSMVYPDMDYTSPSILIKTLV